MSLIGLRGAVGLKDKGEARGGPGQEETTPVPVSTNYSVDV